MKKYNWLKEKLLSDCTVFGAWSIISSPSLIELAALAGLDFQILDMEHGIYDLTSLENCIRACEIAECSPLVRVSCGDRTKIQTCLDVGAHGIVVPQIESFEEASKATQASRFSPNGVRGFNPFTRIGNYARSNGHDAIKFLDTFALNAIIIENKKAYNALDEIINISDLDIIYLGSYDMSIALGHRGNVNHPEIQEFLQSSVAKISNAGKIAGVMVKNKDEAKNLISAGARFIVIGVDTNSYFSEIKTQVASYKL